MLSWSLTWQACLDRDRDRDRDRILHLQLPLSLSYQLPLLPSTFSVILPPAIQLDTLLPNERRRSLLVILVIATTSTDLLLGDTFHSPAAPNGSRVGSHPIQLARRIESPIEDPLSSYLPSTSKYKILYRPYGLRSRGLACFCGIPVSCSQSRATSAPAIIGGLHSLQLHHFGQRTGTRRDCNLCHGRRRQPPPQRGTLPDPVVDFNRPPSFRYLHPKPLFCNTK